MNEIFLKGIKKDENTTFPSHKICITSKIHCYTFYIHIRYSPILTKISYFFINNITNNNNVLHITVLHVCIIDLLITTNRRSY